MESLTFATSYLQTPVSYVLVAIATTVFAIYFYTENLRAIQMARKIPGPKTVPILGNALITLGIQPNDVVNKVLEYDIHGPVVRAFLGPKVFIFLYHPRDVEIILSSPMHIDKSPEYRYFKPWLGEGLLISAGEKWRTHRKIIAPTFHLSVLKSFVPFFYENSRDLVERLRDEVGKEFDCHDYLSETTVDILVETAMGLRETKKDNSGYDYAMAVMKMCDIVHRRTFQLYLRHDILFQFTNYAKEQKQLLDIIHALSSEVIRKKTEEFDRNTSSNVEDDVMRSKEIPPLEIIEPNGKKGDSNFAGMHYARDDLDDIDENDVGEKKRCAFLDLMLEIVKNGGKLTEEEIKEEVDTIMFEGHDTTTAGSSFTLCMLGIYQDIQQRVYEELNEIYKGSNRPCTFQDTLKMKYLERVILETLRLFPPVPIIARTINQDVKIVTNNYILPKTSTILISPFRIHRLEEFYPNPDKFDPDNFLPEKMQNRHYYSFIPFSAGPRSCVGRKYAMLKLKVLLSTILRNYKILSDHTEKDFRLRADIILKRVEGFQIKIEPRNKNCPEVFA